MMNIISYIWRNLMALLDKVKKLANYNAVLLQTNAELQAKLAEALSNDAADAQAIAEAQAAAEQVTLQEFNPAGPNTSRSRNEATKNHASDPSIIHPANQDQAPCPG